jgi:hypothetical protein
MNELSVMLGKIYLEIRYSIISRFVGDLVLKAFSDKPSANKSRKSIDEAS